MPGKSYLLLAVSAFLLGAASGQQSSTETSAQHSARRGTAMFLYDRAAWVSTDDLLVSLPADRRADVGGWIVSPSDKGLRVDYFGKSDPQRIVFSNLVNGQSVTDSTIYPLGSEPVLHGPALQMAHALSIARAEMDRHTDWLSCASAPFNTIVLPPELDGTISVYFLTPQTENDKFPFGGHYEVDVAADGKIVSSRAFARSCLTIAKDAGSTGAKPAALYVTHILDSLPTEVHVFEQLNIGVPLYVGIDSPPSMWKVENGAVAQVDSPVNASK